MYLFLSLVNRNSRDTKEKLFSLKFSKGESIAYFKAKNQYDSSIY